VSELDESLSPADVAYIKAINNVRDAHGNFEFLNKILSSPNETKFILQESNSKVFLRPIPYFLIGLSGIAIGFLGLFGIESPHQIILMIGGVSILVVTHLNVKKTDSALYATSMIAYRFGKI